MIIHSQAEPSRVYAMMIWINTHWSVSFLHSTIHTMHYSEAFMTIWIVLVSRMEEKETS
jgi:hypothetical protein